LEDRGQSQGQICKALGISVMTFHRWRKQAKRISILSSLAQDNDSHAEHAKTPRRYSDLRVENERLRKIITDLLLEKLTLEESKASK
jgi:putative transposase